MSYETNDKMVSHPDHYKSGKYEVIDIIDEFCKDLTGTEAVCTANAIKYILRWKKKNGVQDVKKAIWYLQYMVDKEEERLQEKHAEYDGPDEHCRTCKFRFAIPENDEICENCFGREKYVCDEALVTNGKKKSTLKVKRCLRLVLEEKYAAIASISMLSIWILIPALVVVNVIVFQCTINR